MGKGSEKAPMAATQPAFSYTAFEPLRVLPEFIMLAGARYPYESSVHLLEVLEVHDIEVIEALGLPKRLIETPEEDKLIAPDHHAVPASRRGGLPQHLELLPRVRLRAAKSQRTEVESQRVCYHAQSSTQAYGRPILSHNRKLPEHSRST